MSKATAVVGLQWGDEGKGKIVDFLSGGFAYTARYQGGHNAGHTVIVNGDKRVFHLLPSGILTGCVCVLGNGMVINPEALHNEIGKLPKTLGQIRLLVSNRAHLITPWHSLAEEARSQTSTIGTTKRGIGPAYEDKMARIGIPAGAVCEISTLRQMAESSAAEWEKRLLPEAAERLPELVEQFISSAKKIAPFVADTGHILRKAIREGERVLIEGAQGVMLDIDHGTYPFVTSSSAAVGGAFSGLGIPPHSIGQVLGVAKAYVTRVGGGTLPSEIEGSVADHIVKVGQEFGASTGRQRRPGWLDLVQLKYAVDISGVNALVLTKADVLSGLDKVGLCTSYDMGGAGGFRFIGDEYPSDPYALSDSKPGYEFVPGWDKIDGITEYDRLPREFRNFVELIERHMEVPVKIISTGPERHQTIIRSNLGGRSLKWLDEMVTTTI